MEPNFAGVYYGDEPIMLQEAYRVISELCLWKWMKEYKPHPNEGFMFEVDMTLALIASQLKFPHTGPTFALTLKIMKDIAIHGWEKHWDKCIEMGGAPCPCRRQRGIPAGTCDKTNGVPICYLQRDK
jgi:hypothetical protein